MRGNFDSSTGWGGKGLASKLGKLGTGARNIRLDRVSFEISIFTRRLMIDTVEPVVCIFISRYRNDRVRTVCFIPFD